MTDNELERLLSALSIEEKAGQLAQIPLSACLEGVSVPTGPMQHFMLTPEQISLSGSVIANVVLEAPDCARAVWEMTERHPHHIPPLVMKDIIHGHRTMFPIPLAIGSSFDESIAESMARCGAEEGAACGAHVAFAPMVDVVRDPRWGRAMESPGESPALCARMGAAMVRGTRGGDIARKDRLAACVKHFAGYGLCQAGQEYAPIDVSRTELFNTYFLPFQAAINAGADLVMPCFAAIDRVPCVCNGWLLKDVLRNRMGFDGVTISDWDDPRQLLNHGVAEDIRAVARQCIQAGLDMDMMSFAYLRELARLVRDGIVAEETLDGACLRVLRLKNKLGLFEDPVKNDRLSVQHAVCGSERIQKVAYEAALGSCVLLKNDGVLPLKAGTKIALTGPHADEHAILGGWTLDADVGAVKTLLDSFREETRLSLAAPAEADVILFACGERQQDTGEDARKTKLFLPENQMEELRQLRALQKPIVLLLFCGRPLILTDVLPLCDGVLNCWFPGSQGADAIRALIIGDHDPCGHLSMTFPRGMGQIPIHHDRLSACRPFRPGAIEVNRYIDEVNEPLFPFGFGLSYTRFEVTGAAISGSVTASGPAALSITVKNTGARSGTAVVQVYARPRLSPVIRPDKRLIAWKKIMLRPGQMEIVQISIAADMLRMYDGGGNAIEAKGPCDLAVGWDSSAPFGWTVHCE